MLYVQHKLSETIILSSGWGKAVNLWTCQVLPRPILFCLLHLAIQLPLLLGLSPHPDLNLLRPPSLLRRQGCFYQVSNPAPAARLCCSQALVSSPDTCSKGIFQETSLKTDSHFYCSRS